VQAAPGELQAAPGELQAAPGELQAAPGEPLAAAMQLGIALLTAGLDSAELEAWAVDELIPVDADLLCVGYQNRPNARTADYGKVSASPDVLRQMIREFCPADNGCREHSEFVDI
jgi:hypothetical protein